MPTPLNEHFTDNMLGKTVSFEQQPYTRGKGRIVAINTRVVKTTTFDVHRGRMNIEYECFDLTIEVTEGSEVGALSAGVPISRRDLKGRTHDVTGVRYGELRDAVEQSRTIIDVACG